VENEFESCVRRDFVLSDFSTEFMIWMCCQNIIARTDYDCAFFCMGWEI
jgi:hypothetical protein